MSERKAMIALRDAVVAGKWDHSPNGVVRKVFPYQSASIDDLGLYALEAFNGSVDAAIALLEAVLPKLGWTLADNGRAIIWSKTTPPKILFEASAMTPARALLIATLNALIAKEQE